MAMSERRYLYAQPLALATPVPRGAGRAKIIDQEGREIPDAALQSAVRRLSVRFRERHRQPVRQSHARAAAGAARGDRKTARRRLHPAWHQYPLRHRRADRIDPDSR